MPDNVLPPSPLPQWLAKSPIIAGAASLYKLAISIKNFWYASIPYASRKVGHPVISIGGIRAGGTGKTPSTILVGSHILEMGYNIAFLSRGYRRKSKKLQIVEPFKNIHWEKIGDEPAMIHAALPESWLGVSSKRFHAASILEKKMPKKSVFIIDDGFQHRKIARNLDIVCLHEQADNDMLLPKGLLREPYSALNRANAAFIISDPQKTTRLKKNLSNQFPKLELFELIYNPRCYINTRTGKSAAKLSNFTPVALCGIARPEHFFKTLHDDGIKPCREVAFPDHYRYTEYDIHSIQELYSHGLLTTEKDAIRLLNDRVVPDGNFWYVKIDLMFDCEDSLKRFNKLLETIF